MQLSMWLKLNSMTQSELARSIGLTRDHIQKIATGKTIPGRLTIELIHAYTKGQVTYVDFGVKERAKPVVSCKRYKQHVIEL